MSSPLGGGRPPISIGIQPQIALFGVLLGGVCAIAAYTEKYQRNQEEIDELLKTKYSANIRDQQAKMPQITRTIRGGDDFRVDSAMNKLVWGGKAGLTKPATSATNSSSTTTTGGTGTGGAAGSASSSSSSDDDSSSSDEEWDSSSSSSSSADEEDGMDDSQLSKKERRRRRKERKRKRAERRKQREVEQQRFEAERNKVMVQSVAAGAAVGAVAVAASIFLGSSRK